MGFDHLRYGVHGVNHGLQEDNGWSDWVSASSTRSWCLRNPLQDWLELHGENAGFERDPEPDPRTDFREFIFAKGSEFEAAVVRLLARQTDVSVIEGFANPSRSLEARDATFAAMARGAPVIAQGVLWDDEHRTYGAADLLVRSDILRQLFPDALNEDEALSGARALGLSSCHYCVIDIKFTTLRLDRRWTASREHLPYLERRDSGTQYTTKELADEIVRYALEPIVYFPGPAEGAEPAEWRRKSSAALLKLKVCDPAVGSGAILVAACRYLAERLIEAWQDEMARDMPPAGLPLGFMPGEEDLELLARRVVTDHSLFGVDRNPMAAEMAKLSLWLTTMAKDRPFTFLDHAIHAGDSLLGITSLEQLERFNLSGGRAQQLGFLHPIIERETALAIDLGRQLSQLTVLDMRDSQEKQALYELLTEEVAHLAALADLLVGVTLSTAGRGERAAAEERQRVLTEFVEPAYLKTHTHEEFSARVEDIQNEAAYLLDTGRPAKAPDRRCLHWPLAFPEVFLDPDRSSGFDAMVGNPPFLGGKRVSGALGSEFREYLTEQVAKGRRGNSDLVGYFYLRSGELTWGIGMLATNSLAQGDSREVSLDWLLSEEGWSIHRAVKSRPWPGVASLEVAQLWLRRGPWSGVRYLNGTPTTGVSASLEEIGREVGAPNALVENDEQAFQGCILAGMGFVISREVAEHLCTRDARNAHVIRGFLNGEELNESPTQTPNRLAIDFSDFDLAQAERYPDCLSILEEHVLPLCREKIATYPGRLERWWQFWNTRPAMRRAISRMDRVLVMTIHSKTVQPVFVQRTQVISHAIVVFAYDDDFHLGVLSSAFHWWWAMTRGSTIRTDLRYTPTDCFETFPQPGYSEAVDAAGKAFDEHRQPMMIANNEGLTKTYNRVHDPADASPGIVRLRELHVELDYAVRDAYGWQKELRDLGHGFHETSQGVRYTVGLAARTEMLDLLLELNHKRYAEEVAAGLHDKKKSANGKARANAATQEARRLL